MKSKLLFLTVLMLGVLTGLYSCSEEDNTGPIPLPSVTDTITVYPQKMSYTNIDEKLVWKTGKEESPNPIIVNSKDELLQYVEGDSDFYSGIDFSNHSILLIHGGIDYEVLEIMVQDFQALSNTEYFLRVLVILTMEDSESHWVTAIMTEKLDENVSVQVYVSNAIQI